jgi:uncharacterized protein YbaR (Trm112 family)/SAM-dependent methyltransferase
MLYNGKRSVFPENGMAKQSLGNKQAEVQFRRKLMKQNRGEACCFIEEPDSSDVFVMIEERMQRTREMVEGIHAAGIAIEPFLEVGAERCQRALVLENEFDMRGIAADISLDSLMFAERIAVKYGYQKLPVRICCDANNLPIRPNSLPFTFCYQTLHHFSDPSPIVASLQRILSNEGSFYFDEEPVRMKGRIPMFRRGNKPVGFVQKTLAKMKLLDFVSDTGRAEVEAGVTETDFTLGQWKDLLDGFDIAEVTVDSRLVHGKKLARLLDTNGFSRLWVELMGGNIHGLCHKKQKAEAATVPAVHDMMDAFICPECLESGAENRLASSNGRLLCSTCGTTFPIVNGIHMLLTKKLGTTLYPEYST